MEQHPAVDTDFFFTRLKQEVYKFYTKYYFGIDRKWKRRYHITLMREYYEPAVFNGLYPRELRIHKEEFLAMIQVLVDSRTE
jgi:hypothetical protein